MLGRKIAGDDVVAAVVAGKDEIGSGAAEIRREQEFRVRNNDGVGGTAGIEMDYGRWRPETALSIKRSGHSPPLLERD